MASTLTLVREVVQELATSTFNVAVFGGWAEELLKVAAPRIHSDVDLLIFDPGLPRLEQFVADRGEVTGKGFSHKRAFVAEAVVV